MASRKDQKEALRAQRLERERAAAAAQQRKRLVGYGIAGVLALAAIVVVIGLVLPKGGDEQKSEGGFPKGTVPAQKVTELNAAAKAAGCTVKRVKEEGSDHVSGPVKYKTNPPTSGDHAPPELVPDDGAYREAPEKERLVHSLEHGRIVIQYRPTAPAALQGSLKALFDEDPYHMLLAPNTTNMPFEVAATGWTLLIGCREANDKVYDALRAFRDRFRDHGPELVP